LEEDSHQTIMP